MWRVRQVVYPAWVFLFLAGNPLNEFADALVLQEFFNRVEVPAELFLFGDQVVNFTVAIFAD